MTDLFADAADEQLRDLAPLALRLRPAKLEDFVGQQQVVAGIALARAIEEDRVTSAVFLAAEERRRRSHASSQRSRAPTSRSSRLSRPRSPTSGAPSPRRDRLGADNRRTILFLDEIHRFNKAVGTPSCPRWRLLTRSAPHREPLLRGQLGAPPRADLRAGAAGWTSRRRRAAAAEELDASVPDVLVALIGQRAGGGARCAEHPRARVADG